MARPRIKSDGRTITVRVPISIKKRGGKKVVLAPNGASLESGELFCQQVDNAMVKALARAFRWRDMLETGTLSTIIEIAEGEKINESYVSRILRLTLLAPDIVEAIVEGRHSPNVTLAMLMRRLPMSWVEQRATIAGT
jgi:hypothetical protein